MCCIFYLLDSTNYHLCPELILCFFDLPLFTLYKLQIPPTTLTPTLSSCSRFSLNLVKLTQGDIFLPLSNTLNMIYAVDPPFPQPEMFDIFKKKCLGSSPEFQINFSGFEQYFAAQYDFVLTDATVSKMCLRG